MAQFPRPANSIEDFHDLKLGDRLWHVYGIWPPQMFSVATVTRTPAPFLEHPKYSDIHDPDSIVFDVHYDGWNNPTMEFASDGNLIPGHSYNDNYWFRSEIDATTAVGFLRRMWEDSGRIPDEIEKRRRSLEDIRGSYQEDWA